MRFSEDSEKSGEDGLENCVGWGSSLIPKVAMSVSKTLTLWRSRSLDVHAEHFFGSHVWNFIIWRDSKRLEDVNKQ